MRLYVKADYRGNPFFIADSAPEPYCMTDKAFEFVSEDILLEINNILMLFDDNPITSSVNPKIEIQKLHEILSTNLSAFPRFSLDSVASVPECLKENTLNFKILKFDYDACTMLIEDFIDFLSKLVG